MTEKVLEEMIANGEPIFGQLGGNSNIVILDKHMFNKITDAIAFNLIDEYETIDVMMMGRFVSIMRRLLFDTDNRTEKEEN